VATHLKIVNEYPPRFEEMVAAFPEAAGHGVVFAWGDTIYNPSGSVLRPEIRAHEAIHGERQGGAINIWWDVYLKDEEFRFKEELVAHKAEYQLYCKRHQNRVKRERYLQHVAEKLAAPLYGSLISPQKALDLLR
jgi:hypothetical protein